MILPIPSDAQAQAYFAHVFTDAIRLQRYLGTPTAKTGVAGTLLRGDVLTFTHVPDQSVITNSSHMQSFFANPDKVQNLIALHMQCTAMEQFRADGHDMVCDTALQVATHEILDNDHMDYYLGDRSPLAPVINLGFELAQLALKNNYRQQDFLENIDELIGQTYSFQQFAKRLKPRKLTTVTNGLR